MALAFGVWKQGQQSWGNGRCGVLPSEITTPSGAPPSVLLNDSLDAGKEYAAEIVTAPSGATFFEFEWDGSFEYEGPVPLTFTYVVREYGAYIAPPEITVSLGASGAFTTTEASDTATFTGAVSGSGVFNVTEAFDIATFFGNAIVPDVYYAEFISTEDSDASLVFGEVSDDSPQIPSGARTGNQAIDMVLSRIGKWQSTVLRSTVLLEMQQIQREYENSATIPSFLFRSKRIFLGQGSYRSVLPEGFIRFDDDDSYVYAKGETQSAFLQRKRAFVFQGQQIESFPKYFMVSGAITVAPSPREDISLDIYAAYHDVPVEDANVSNLWLAHADYLLIASTAYRMAKNLQDFELANALYPDALAQEARLRNFSIAATNSLMSDVMGEDYAQ